MFPDPQKTVFEVIHPSQDSTPEEAKNVPSIAKLMLFLLVTQITPLPFWSLESEDISEKLLL